LVREGVDAGELAVTADLEFTVEFLMHGLHGVMEDSLSHGEDRQQLLEQVNTMLTVLLSPTHRPQ
jgi:hypothetical protein